MTEESLRCLCSLLCLYDIFHQECIVLKSLKINLFSVGNATDLIYSKGSSISLYIYFWNLLYIPFYTDIILKYVKHNSKGEF